MNEKLLALEARFLELDELISSPDLYDDPKNAAKLLKEQKDLTPIIDAYRALRTAEQTVEESLELMQGETDPDMKEMLQEEYQTAKDDIEKLQEDLKLQLLPKDENDDKNVIVEIRGGAGGEEAQLFANSLYRMYTMYAEKNRWKVEIMNMNQTELGGIKEVSFEIEGEGAYSRLKFESGVHRVQRVPETESQGRVHTSTVTVAVLPTVEDVEIDINPTDLKIDVFRASGAGGQHINKTESAVRITHLPTGVVVECQDERSQHKNRDKAMKVLRSRIYEAELAKQNAEIAAERKTQVGTGDRSERIRTYNYPESRVSDHRIKMTLYKLEQFLNGDLDEIIDGLITDMQAKRLLEQGD
ncbi:MAG: peptide chain release factor 1 [Clostridia bacterium]